VEFDFLWLLLAIPAAFVLGWLASQLEARQWRREQRDAPKAYFKGLNLLLNEQQDKAIDAFIEAVQNDPNTSELHFALGNLFRRRGEFERAVRVHQHLLNRADLSEADRQRAQHALAQDFMKAGLFDRAEEAFRALEGSPFDTEARLALLALYERSRDWRAASDVAAKLEKSGTGSFASRIAHYWCEIAIEADARGETAEAEAALQRALTVAPQAPRAWLLIGQRLARAGRHAEALQAWAELRARSPAAFALIGNEYAKSALAAGQTDVALANLADVYTAHPSTDLLHALSLLHPDARPQGVLEHLARQPSLSAAAEVLKLAPKQWAEDTPSRLHDAVARAAQPLQRYRCAGCGFEARQYFWQCPGCHNWDSFPPQRLEQMH
jgi:lipopolysaccharide assembly protein B